MLLYLCDFLEQRVSHSVGILNRLLDERFSNLCSKAVEVLKLAASFCVELLHRIYLVDELLHMLVALLGLCAQLLKLQLGFLAACTLLIQHQLELFGSLQQMLLHLAFLSL